MTRACGSLSEAFGSDFLASSLRCLFARFSFSALSLSSVALARSARSHVARRSLLRRARAARRGLGVAFDLGFQGGNPLFNRRHDPRQMRLALERIPARTRPHLGAVDRDLLERYHLLGNQRRHALAQQPVERLYMCHAEVR
jgi:hypothetical protein